MDRPGEQLRAAREARGLSISQVAEKTRISATFLKALEEDDYAVLPGEVFVTGFLRSYARELGLKEKTVMAAYREQAARKAETEPEPAEEPEPSLAEMRAKGPSWRLVFVIVAAAAFAAFLMLAGGDGEEEPTITEAQAPAAPEPPVLSQMSALPVLEGRTSAGAQYQGPSVSQALAPLVVRLHADEDTWYSYTADGGVVANGLLAKGDSKEITASESILLDIGNSGGVRVEYGGEELPYYGPRGKVTRDILFTRQSRGVVQGR